MSTRRYRCPRPSLLPHCRINATAIMPAAMKTGRRRRWPRPSPVGAHAYETVAATPPAGPHRGPARVGRQPGSTTSGHNPDLRCRRPPESVAHRRRPHRPLTTAGPAESRPKNTARWARARPWLDREPDSRRCAVASPLNRPPGTGIPASPDPAFQECDPCRGRNPERP